MEGEGLPEYGSDAYTQTQTLVSGQQPLFREHLSRDLGDAPGSQNQTSQDQTTIDHPACPP